METDIIQRPLIWKVLAVDPHLCGDLGTLLTLLVGKERPDMARFPHGRADVENFYVKANRRDGCRGDRPGEGIKP